MEKNTVKLPGISRIMVIRDRYGPDYVYLSLDLPPATYPFNEENKPSAKFPVAAGLGVDYVRKNFGVDPDEIINPQ